MEVINSTCITMTVTYISRLDSKTWHCSVLSSFVICFHILLNLQIDLPTLMPKYRPRSFLATEKNKHYDTQPDGKVKIMPSDKNGSKISCKLVSEFRLHKTTSDFIYWLRFFRAFSSAVSCICVVRLLFVLFYVLFVCKCVLPPGDNPIAVNKYIIS